MPDVELRKAVNRELGKGEIEDKITVDDAISLTKLNV